jgi:hypothetical protein
MQNTSRHDEQLKELERLGPKLKGIGRQKLESQRVDN